MLKLELISLNKYYYYTNFVKRRVPNACTYKYIQCVEIQFATLSFSLFTMYKQHKKMLSNYLQLRDYNNYLLITIIIINYNYLFINNTLKYLIRPYY